jgi:aryl-alcohol dehydrogenase-like predicted oxidoreductase
MKYVGLGRTDIEVSVICMGCWAFAGGDYWGEQAESQSVAAVHAAMDRGVNFFDTAEGYGAGASEAVLGKALEGRRKDAVIASKVSGGHLAPQDVAEACERSLEQLRTDHIDLYQIHWASRKVPLAETLGALERLREAGKVRAIGVSNFGPGDMDDLAVAGRGESNQLPYSLLWRAIEFEILTKCVEQEVSVLSYSSLMQGLLAGRFEKVEDVPPHRTRTRHFKSANHELARHGESGCEAETFAAIGRIRDIAERAGHSMADVSIAWLLAQEGVTSVIAGMRTPEQAERNARAADVELAPEVVAELTSATEELKGILGSNADMWQAESRIK